LILYYVGFVLFSSWFFCCFRDEQLSAGGTRGSPIAFNDPGTMFNVNTEQQVHILKKNKTDLQIPSLCYQENIGNVDKQMFSVHRAIFDCKVCTLTQICILKVR